MRGLVKLEHGAIEAFMAIAKSKNGPRRARLESLSEWLNDSYEWYDKVAPEFAGTNATALTQEQKSDLLHCYEVNTAALGILVMSIRQAQSPSQRAFCPYCGINSNYTIEHYLPREKRPEFAVCQFNLVPACGRCNLLKGTVIEDGSGRQVFHFYYDSPPFSTRWLYAAVSVDEGVPKAEYRLEVPEGMGSAERGMVINHYDRLQLLSRYSERSPEVFSEALGSIGMQLSRDQRATMYLAKAADYEPEYGVNYWKAAALRAMAASDVFLEFAAQ